MLDEASLTRLARRGFINSSCSNPSVTNIATFNPFRLAISQLLVPSVKDSDPSDNGQCKLVNQVEPVRQRSLLFLFHA